METTRMHKYAYIVEYKDITLVSFKPKTDSLTISIIRDFIASHTSTNLVAHVALSELRLWVIPKKHTKELMRLFKRWLE